MEGDAGGRVHGSDRQTDGVSCQDVRPTTRASGMFRTAGVSLETKRVAFPHYVKALITICVCLHGV